MNGKQTATTVPKNSLIDAIIEKIPFSLIQSYLHIQSSANLGERLSAFSKSELLEVLTSIEEGQKALVELEQEFPLSSSPTLYLVNLISHPSIKEIMTKTQELSEKKREAALTFGEHRSVRAIYILSPATSKKNMVEIPLVYEARFEYVEGDHLSPDYSERVAVCELQRAYVWLLEKHQHAIVSCSDFSAVNPIIHFCGQNLDMVWALPNLTENQMNQIISNAHPRTATFSQTEQHTPSTNDGLDIQTVTFADPNLGSKRAFKRYRKSLSRQQTAGYFMSHPDVPRGGLGVARRYGRMWTPVHLSRIQLAALAQSMIQKAEEKLQEERETNPVGYLNYFSNIPVLIGEKELRGKVKDIFFQLTQSLIIAQKNQGKETQITPLVVNSIIDHQDRLFAQSLFVIDCPNCIHSLAYCPNCDLPLVGAVENNTLKAKCPKCKEEFSDELYCNCGNRIEVVSLINHLRVVPYPELTDSIINLFDQTKIGKWKDTFVIDGTLLHIIALPTPTVAAVVKLRDLSLWKTRAHFHTISAPNESNSRRYIKTLNVTKEKCPINGYHPTVSECTACINKVSSVLDLEAGNICLPKLFGIPISEHFDGIHHGREFADVRYTDSLNGVDRRIAIHLKSRKLREPKNGLGRSIDCIKELYTQLFFSAYAVLENQAQADVVGVSIPNKIKDNVIDSMNTILNRVGLSFMAVDENDWLKIISAVEEQLYIDNQA